MKVNKDFINSHYFYNNVRMKFKTMRAFEFGLSILFLNQILELNAANYYYSDSSENSYGDLLSGLSRDCPLKCRCMAIGHIGLEVLGQNWQSDESWRADGHRDMINSEHQGRDMMCTGRGTLPWPMPDGRS